MYYSVSEFRRKAPSRPWWLTHLLHGTIFVNIMDLNIYVCVRKCRDSNDPAMAVGGYCSKNGWKVERGIG